MIPIRDVNPSRSFPVVNLLIVVVCSVVWLYQWSLPEDSLNVFIAEFGLVPSRVVDQPYSLITHMFLHGGWFHVIGNMWFLWVFGDNVEDRLGKFRYPVFYLTAGFVAALVQTFISLIFGGSDVPMVGASGAVSGVLGAYMKLFPGARVLALVPIFFFLTFLEMPAVTFIGLWFLVQIVNGVISLPLAGFGGVAWWAHVGGFLAGYLLIDRFLARGRYYY